MVAALKPSKKTSWQLVAIVALSTTLVVGGGAYFGGFLPGQRVRNAEQPQGDARIKGNRKSMIYHLPTCKNYDDISPDNIEWFKTPEEAEKAGYRMAKNCS